MGDSTVLISCTICPNHIFQTYFGQVGFHHEPMSKTNYSEAPVLCCSDLSVSGERLFRCEEFAVQICVCVFQVKRCFNAKSLLFRSVCVCVCVSSETLFQCEEFAVQICVCVSSEALFQCEEFAVQISVGVSGERPFRCEDCGRGFIRWFTLKRHRQKHQGLVHFTCQVCGDAFSSRESLKRHRRVHTGESASVGSISIVQHWK